MRLRNAVQERGLAGTALQCLKLPLAPLLRTELAERWTRDSSAWIFDRRFDVDTSGFIQKPIPGELGEFSNPYLGTPAGHFKRILRSLNIRCEEFSFVDFGSGKGRVVLLAAAFPFRSVLGVEFSRELHDIAERNIVRYRGPRACANVKSIYMDAGEFQIPDGKLLLYFYNPFDPPVLEKVVENIGNSVRQKPRESVIAYLNPKSRAVFDRAPFLEIISDRQWFVLYKTKVPNLKDSRI